MTVKTMLIFFLLLFSLVSSADDYDKALDYYENRKTDFSPLKSYQLFRVLALDGNADAQLKLFALLYEFPNTLEEQAEEALKGLIQLAREGNTFAQFNVGLILSNGFYLRQDIKKANEWLTISAEAGHARSKVLLGINMLNLFFSDDTRDTMPESEYQMIYSNLKYAEKTNEAQGLLALGTLVFTEKRNLQEAERLLLLSHELGNEHALEYLAEFREIYEKTTH